MLRGTELGAHLQVLFVENTPLADTWGSAVYTRARKCQVLSKPVHIIQRLSRATSRKCQHMLHSSEDQKNKLAVTLSLGRVFSHHALPSISITSPPQTQISIKADWASYGLELSPTELLWHCSTDGLIQWNLHDLGSQQKYFRKDGQFGSAVLQMKDAQTGESKGKREIM